MCRACPINRTAGNPNIHLIIGAPGNFYLTHTNLYADCYAYSIINYINTANTAYTTDIDQSAYTAQSTDKTS